MFRPKRLIAAFATVASVGGLMGGLAAPAGAQTEPSGDASGIYGIVSAANVLLGPLVPILNLPATPFAVLPPGESNTVLNVPLAPLLTTSILSAASNAFGEAGVASSASVVDASVLDPLLNADAITSECSGDENGTSGSAGLVNADALNGAVVVPLNAPPNTVVPLPFVGSLTLNEQEQDEAGITVRSVHLRVDVLNAGLLTADIVISESSCFPGDVVATAARPTSGTPNLTG